MAAKKKVDARLARGSQFGAAEPVYDNPNATVQIGDNLHLAAMFENVDSVKPEKHWLLWASLKAIGLGIACFFPAFFLSLLVTIP